jgi:multidrug resistance efflux pump
MGDQDYKAALEQAKADFSTSRHRLTEYIQKQEELEMHLCALRETIAALSRITGQEFVEEDDLGLTDTIRLTLKMATGEQMTALDVRQGLEQLGYDLRDYHNVLASIHTVLKRLEARREIRKAGTVKGKPAYTWVPRLGFHPFHGPRSRIKV